MFRTEKVLVLRETRFRESDRILTVLTAEAGKKTLAAHGALSEKSRIAAATQQLTYSELTLFEKGGRLSVREGVVLEGFPGLRTELERFALGCYIAECLELFSTEDQPEPELMQLGLNCLYALSEGLADCRKVKAAFELRLMAEEGYAPMDAVCRKCGSRQIPLPVFLTEDGSFLCGSCARDFYGLQMTDLSLAALRHILHAPARRILAFRIPEEDMRILARAAERWLLHCAERKLPTLDYYNMLRTEQNYG